MSSRSRLFLLVLGWLALTAAGCVVVVLHASNVARADFLSEAGVMHRLLSQQIRQHEALIETIAVLQPAPVAGREASAEQQLSGIHPAVLRVLRQDDVVAWPEEQAPALDEALQRSAAAGRAVAAQVGPSAGGFWLVRSAKPASFALQFDLRQLARDAMESPFAGPSSVTAWLEQTHQPKIMLMGQSSNAATSGAWRHHFRQTLTARSLNVDLVATRPYDPLDWPWAVLAAWCLATSFLALGLAAWMQARRSSDVEPLSRFAFDEDDRSGDDQSVAWSRRRPSWPAADRARGSAASQPLNVTLRRLDVEPPELAVARGAIDQAARESRRGSEMIANLRRSAQQPLHEGRLQPLLWDELLRDAFELVEPHCARLGITTTMITDDEAAFVLADRVALEQVVNRLLDQAVIALARAPEGERQLDVTLAAQPELAVLSVHDTGDSPGSADVGGEMDSSLLDLRQQELQQCARLLAEMDGRLTIEAASPRGAIVRVALPRVKG